jgi:phage I-like protein
MEKFMGSSRTQKVWPDENERLLAATTVVPHALERNEEKRKRRLHVIELAENVDGKWVHILPYGEHYHPVWGDIDITEERVDRFVKNFHDGVRGIQLDIDYAHKLDQAKGDKAAGWIKDLQKRDDGLWALVEWTTEASTELADGQWKYMSAEYVDTYCTQKKEPECWDDVMLGAALTNRPYMKELTPINFSEFFEVPDGKIPQDDARYRPAEDSAYRCLNCLYYRDGSCLVVDGEISEDYTSNYFRPIYNENLEAMIYSRQEDGTIQFAVKEKELTTPPKEVKMNEFLKKLAAAMGIEVTDDSKEEEVTEKALAEVKRLSEAAAAPKTNTEDDKAKQFAEMFPEEAKQLAESAIKLKEAETDRVIGRWEENKETHLGVPPVILSEQVRPLRVTLSEADAAKFDEVMDKILEKGLVQYGEKGVRRTPDQAENDQAAFISEVKKYQEENKTADGKTISFSDAVTQVARTQPDLALAYKRDVKPENASE